MVTGLVTSQPIGHYEFCQGYRSECSIVPSDLEPLVLTDGLLAELKDVTVSVNASVRPMSDELLYGKVEFWNYPEGAGDCEDYALLKQRILSQKGVSRANLLLTVLRKPDGEGHAVRTDGGDFVLDNLNNEILPWDETGYTFRKRQAIAHSGRWVTIEDGHSDPIVSSTH